MDWNKTKTIFILSFLVLNVFLTFQLIEKINKSQLDQVTESTIEEQLEEEDITYPAIPKNNEIKQYISGKSKKFTPDELGDLDGQNINIRNETMIMSTFEEPVQFSEEMSDEELRALMENNVMHGEDYTYWGHDESNNVLMFFQTYKNSTIYFNKNGMVLMELNEDNEITRYYQTYLVDLEEMDVEEQSILPAIKAIENLYRKYMLPSGSEITHISMGYYTLVPLSGGGQVVAPTWHIRLKEGKSFFVNAVEGQVIEVKAEEFLEQVYQ
ncbi:two-component system regulatory protein YycI [Bacillus marinisedimentorum]|uniref:two-component system regulatory protein YycI n=1 Tax=Bacillus marinisedimentorum TaxID=1821260 RepID=UPI0008731CA5|nr:two-component system regulatory protein YycI [Bacillus marinisedimentorum]